MREKVIARLLYWRNRDNGYASGIADWQGFVNWRNTGVGVHIKDLDLATLSDENLISLLEDVVANFEYLSHQ